MAVDETTSPADGEGVGSYKKSKVLAERLVERTVTEQSLPAVIVNPSTIIGQRDLRPTPTGRMVIEAACGRIPVFVDTSLNLVHVDDVVAGHLAAMERGAHRRALHPWWPERLACANCWPRSPDLPAASRRSSNFHAHQSTPNLRCRGTRPEYRQGAFIDGGRPGNGQPPHVLHFG